MFGETMYCCYCGFEQGEKISCCGEHDWVTKEELDEYYNYSEDEEEENE